VSVQGIIFPINESGGSEDPRRTWVKDEVTPSVAIKFNRGKAQDMHVRPNLPHEHEGVALPDRKYTIPLRAT
jgi:hypothetical protein